MKCLTACDALSEHLVRVTADMHPSPDRGAVDRETVYAVEEEGLGNSGARKFLGLVDSRQANAFPNRIFADLLRPWQSACVKRGYAVGGGARETAGRHVLLAAGDGRRQHFHRRRHP